MDKRTKALMEFLDASVSVYHAADYIKNVLEQAGYQRLSEGERWTLSRGGKYYLMRGGTAVLAFRVPQGDPKGFLMSGSHMDRPTFKIKENAELTGKYTRLTTEVYGSPIMGTWLDRPLSVAGRVLVETEDGVQSRLVNMDRDLMLMPNVSRHHAKDDYKLNPAVDTLPLLGSADAEGKFHALLEEAAGGKILGHDLYLYIRQKSSVWGLNEEYFSSAAIDDLECTWCCTRGFLNAKEGGSIPVLSIFDNEEVGSSSAQGAASTLLEMTLRRICQALSLDEQVMLANSFMISADNAHAIHPNHPEHADPNNAPVMNGGVVLKFNARLRYSTDGASAALFRTVCNRAGAKVQTYYNRADMPGGATLGYISLSHVSVPTADIGLPQLAMHSCYESAGVQDAIDLEKAMEVYFGGTLTTDGENYHFN